MEQTVSQTSFTILLTLIYSNAVSKLNFFDHKIASNFLSEPPGAVVNGAIQILLL